MLQKYYFASAIQLQTEFTYLLYLTSLKVLMLEIAQMHLAFYSLTRTFDAAKLQKVAESIKFLGYSAWKCDGWRK